MRYTYTVPRCNAPLTRKPGAKRPSKTLFKFIQLCWIKHGKTARQKGARFVLSLFWEIGTRTNRTKSSWSYTLQSQGLTHKSKRFQAF
jgi:hypothetical protein